MEAALRTAYELYTGKTLDKVDFKEVRGLENIKKATIKLNGVELHVGIAHGLGNARKLLNEIREGKSEFHAIEIMACPGGCIGGGGQPLHHGNSALLKARSQALYYMKGLKGAAALRRACCELQHFPDVDRLIDKVYAAGNL